MQLLSGSKETCQNLDIQMEAARAKMSAWKLCIYSDDAAIILNVLDHSLNNIEFTKHLFSICHAYYTKMLHRMFRYEKEAVSIINELVE